MTNLDTEFTSLQTEIKTLQERYVDRFIPAKPEDGPEEFEHDVKAFCLLAHAAFEEFVELVSETIMMKIENEFLSKKIGISTICFIMTYGQPLNFADDDTTRQASCFEIIRQAISESKKKHSTTLKDNHGLSLKYMKRLLVPVGLNLPSGAEVDSLKVFADARGSFAHTMAKRAMYGEYRKAKKVLTPEAALAAAKDCLTICEDIKIRSQQLN